MAESFRMTAARRLLDQVMRLLLAAGLGPGNARILTVAGRRTGRVYRTPVILALHDGQRYLVSPYGERAWTGNARAAGRVSLRRGRSTEEVGLQELGPAEAAPVLRRYVGENPITRKFFEASPSGPDEAFEAEALRHPAFRIS